MTRADTISRIQRAHFVQSLSTREIARRFRMSRKTVRRAIEVPEGAFLRFDAGKVPPEPC